MANILIGIGCALGAITLIGWMIHRVCILPIERALDDAFGGDK
jgi:hypothetical protein